MIGRNILVALLLSLILSFIVVIIYAFYPLISVMLSNQEGSGIGAISSVQIMKGLLIVEPLLFIVIFALLQWRSRKS